MCHLLQNYKALRKQLATSVAYSHGRRVFDGVVFELVGADGLSVRRTVTLLGGHPDRREHDSKRVQRLARRLRALGFANVWHALRHPMDGVGGTVRMRCANWIG